ncbi:TIGR04283 family arsenosugar biosynthesis glycosyltransferase [Vulcanococcus limneticus Candia 3F8]|uniref:TIGR04283 family arsenosugar biosynthesis glycosyltransferase n=1 Tax=Vulcanococcus limneticus TaxID=2170428 RepID=UPI0018E37612|nr:TIGR04283 family arsenosugar biosynthesis glycosyltransferase [Vulcanococcus limneticus]MCP9792654.1 TIGR04283 family arsenosugar biosynthesis glycosyltransferase [Vulcanococcus limneticus MW73D5]MCP9894455.1 TIGR04283 family arsenosugar biosynthesis glycosyltransferase [Vulcanococcus limneticus Candia 3F8]MCP9898028.1 TIGR04283 family arsenosugar biosynthesis glycosyltransferase [Vulcanococcus limneticus Candia 3B3]
MSLSCSSRTLSGSGIDPRALQRYRAACRSLRLWLRLTERHGSVVVALTGGGTVVAERHYPEGDGRDPTSGAQFYYHCHRDGGEHGHLHLFVPAAPGAELTHLIGISLDARGLPIGLFTLNRWVAADAWLPAAETLPLLERFAFPVPDGLSAGASAPEPRRLDPHLGRWLTHFLVFYRPVIAALLQERDACLERHAQAGEREAALEDRRLEIPSSRSIDWSADLAALQAEIQGQIQAVRRRRRPRLSVIIPVLNEAQAVRQCGASWKALEASGAEVLLVDGGSNDDTVALLQQAGLRVVAAPRGRGRQLRTGAARARGEILLFLHADTRLPANGLELVHQGLQGPRCWGRFDVHIDSERRLLAVVAWAINLRSRLSGIATGDQALFMTREAYGQVGGFADQPLMEDIDLSARLKRLGPPVCLRSPVLTSGRRWERHGVWRTILLMWGLRLAYWLGVPATVLVRLYR